MVQKNYKEILIIYSDFYPSISKNLLGGAETYLKKKKKLILKRKELMDH